MELNEHGTMGGRASENTRTSYYAHTQTNGVDPTKLFVSHLQVNKPSKRPNKKLARKDHNRIKGPHFFGDKIDSHTISC